MSDIAEIATGLGVAHVLAQRMRHLTPPFEWEQVRSILGTTDEFSVVPLPSLYDHVREWSVLLHGFRTSLTIGVLRRPATSWVYFRDNTPPDEAVATVVHIGGATETHLLTEIAGE